MALRPTCLILGLDGIDPDVLVNLIAFYSGCGYRVRVGVGVGHAPEACELLVIQRGHYQPGWQCPQAQGDVHIYDYVYNGSSDYHSAFPSAQRVAVICPAGQPSGTTAVPPPCLVSSPHPVVTGLWAPSREAAPSQQRRHALVHIGHHKPNPAGDPWQQQIHQLASQGHCHFWGLGWERLIAAPAPTLHGPSSLHEAQRIYRQAHAAVGVMHAFQRGNTLSGRMWQAPLNGCQLYTEALPAGMALPGVQVVNSFAHLPPPTQTPQQLSEAARAYWDERTRRLADRLSLRWSPPGAFELARLYAQQVGLRHLKLAIERHALRVAPAAGAAMSAAGAPTPLLQQSLRALLWSYGGAIVRALAQLVIQLLLARLLGPAAYGQAMAVFLVLALGWLMAEGGFGAALVQKQDLQPAHIRHALGWVLLIAGATGLGVALAAPWLAAWLGDATLQPLLQASGLLIPLQALSNIPASLLKRELNLRQAQFIQVGGYILAYGVCGVGLAWAGAGAWSLVLAFGLHSLLVLAGSQAALPAALRVWRPSWRGHAELRRYGLQITGTNLINWAIENLDRLLISRYWGAAALGAYAAAANLSRAPANLLVSSAQSVSFASAARLQDDLPALRRAYLGALQLCGLVAWPLFLWLAVHAHSVVQLLYGQRWQAAGPLFAAFCTALPLYALLAISGPVLWAVDAVRAELRAQAVCLLVLCGGLLLSIGFPLAQVVWGLVPVYALRLALVLRPLSLRLQLPWRHTARACLPGLWLGGLTTGLGLGAQALWGRGPAAAWASALAMLLLTGWLLWQAPAWWLGSDLLGLLHRQALRWAPRWQACLKLARLS